ncbi:hypothetical protein COEX109129_12095 [Corallococcus exiguus]
MSPLLLKYSAPRKPAPVAEMVPLFVTVPVAKKMATPPTVSLISALDHGRATMLAPALMVTVVYSGTRMACAEVRVAVGFVPPENAAVSGVPVKVSRVPVSAVTRTNCQLPTAFAVKSNGPAAPEVTVPEKPEDW